MKILKRGLLALLAVIVVLVAVIAFNTFQYRPSSSSEVTPFALGADVEQATETLSRAIAFQTESIRPGHPDFVAFTDFLVTAFPAVHGAMTRQTFAANTVLYTWEGKDDTLAPVLLTAHYDVVPIGLDSLDRWEHPPYSGAVADGYVWGRGTLDNKGALIAMLAAAEHLIGQGFSPDRTIHFSFGGDEEVGGTGAISVAQHFIGQGIRLAWALDEGSFVLDDVIPGLTVPVASINVSEKGYLTATLIARDAGGHSALPPSVTAVGRVARAVDRLQSTPMAGGLDGASGEFFNALGQHFSLDRRALFANQWLFGPVIERVLSGSAATNAMLRTTTAPTMLSGSAKENVLATEATATVNFRLHPRDTVDDVIDHITRTIDDPEIEIVVNRDFASEASPVADAEGPGYKDIEASIFAVYGDVASVPGLTIAATDARHYALAAEAAYRINPFLVTGDDIARFHGTNERLSIDNLKRGMDFYGALISKQ